MTSSRAIVTVDSASWLEAHPEPAGWRVEHHARRWDGQAWAWKPLVARAATVEAATRAVFAGRLTVYDVGALASELAARAARATADPEPEL